MKHTKRYHLKKKSNKITRKSYKLQKGGDLTFIKDFNNINLFTDEEMEKYMNPIYGYIMCNTGFISNNFYLAEIGAIDTNESKIISKMCSVVPGNIQPINDIIINSKKLSAKQIGNYIAMKYITKKYPEFSFYTTPAPKNRNMIKYRNQEKPYPFNMSLNKYIPLNGYDEERMFHLILFCLWWVAKNDEGIKDYYRGINDTFDFINKLEIEGINYYQPINISSNTYNSNLMTQQPTFEYVIHKLLDNKFIIYNQGMTKNFCEVDTGTYPDCGETTMRNLINLLCFNNNKLDISLLEKYYPIPSLKEFYMKFDTFEKQSSYNSKELNARDSWSKLIIENGNNNIKFLNNCKNEEKKYEIDDGMSSNDTKSNFLQLLHNLLPGIEKWDDLLTENITNISNNTKNGIGNILIEHKEIGSVFIHLQQMHYYMTINSKKDDDNDTFYENFSDRKKDIILFLKDTKKIRLDENNYLDYSFRADYFGILINKCSYKLIVGENMGEDDENEYKNNNITMNLVKKLIRLSLTNKYDKNLRKEVQIHTDYIDTFFEGITKNLPNFNDYTYVSNDFDFVNKFPYLTHLNFVLDEISDILQSTIDLTPLKNIKSIGSYFLAYTSIKTIDLTPLQNVQSIGDNFLSNTQIKQINLTPLQNLQSIGDNFLSSTQIKQIDLTPLKNIKYIGNYFLSDTQIKQINLTPLENIKSIGNEFLFSIKIKEIDLRYLKNFKLFYNELIDNKQIYNCYIIISTEQKNNLTEEELKKLLPLKIKIIVNDTNPNNKKTKFNTFFTTLKNAKNRFFNKTRKN